MWKRLVQTSDDRTLFLIRVMLGLVMFPHGAQKALGWFGGFGWSGTVGYFTGTLGVPAIVAVLIILGEFLGAIGLITGTLTRIAAAGIVIIQLGAIWFAHAQFGFFMNWAGTAKGEGFEYALLAITMAVVLVLGGAGRWSVDRALATR